MSDEQIGNPFELCNAEREERRVERVLELKACWPLTKDKIFKISLVCVCVSTP
jgi:hypothetical protein